MQMFHQHRDHHFRHLHLAHPQLSWLARERRFLVGYLTSEIIHTHPGVPPAPGPPLLAPPAVMAGPKAPGVPPAPGPPILAPPPVIGGPKSGECAASTGTSTSSTFTRLTSSYYGRPESAGNHIRTGVPPAAGPPLPAPPPGPPLAVMAGPRAPGVPPAWGPPLLTPPPGLPLAVMAGSRAPGESLSPPDVYLLS
ncbi:hypothetical protein MRX96_039098 [Rhipicephalus microplus]